MSKSGGGGIGRRNCRVQFPNCVRDGQSRSNRQLYTCNVTIRVREVGVGFYQVIPILSSNPCPLLSDTSSTVPLRQLCIALVGRQSLSGATTHKGNTMENKCSCCSKPADRVNAMVVLTNEGEKYTHFSCFSNLKAPIRPMGATRDRKPIWWARK